MKSVWVPDVSGKSVKTIEKPTSQMYLNEFKIRTVFHYFKNDGRDFKNNKNDQKITPIIQNQK
ncbi:hypothetical protein [Chryseobacterium sp. GVT01B]|uniref:hypothetical protein n=1 Tax=Chryseobacterium sp. GVT01B TaxID=2862675 RepID=UPI001CBC8635|nr:hypothetical protein [Chryseobacterium sp. GVT01B]